MIKIKNQIFDEKGIKYISTSKYVSGTNSGTTSNSRTIYYINIELDGFSVNVSTSDESEFEFIMDKLNNILNPKDLIEDYEENEEEEEDGALIVSISKTVTPSPSYYYGGGYGISGSNVTACHSGTGTTTQFARTTPGCATTTAFPLKDTRYPLPF